jgi:hypothetical protein
VSGEGGKNGREKKNERKTKKESHIEGEKEKERESVIVNKQAILRYYFYLFSFFILLFL